MPNYTVGDTISKMFQQTITFGGAQRANPGFEGDLGIYGNSNCLLLETWFQADILNSQVFGFANYRGDFIIDNIRTQVDELQIGSSIDTSAMENPSYTNVGVIKDGIIYAAAIMVYNDDPDPSMGNYGVVGILYNGTEFTIENNAVSDQTLFDAVTAANPTPGNCPVILNRDDLDTFLFFDAGNYYSVSLSTGAYSGPHALAVNVAEFLFFNDDVCLYLGTDGSIYDIDDNEYTFDEVVMYNGTNGPTFLYDGTYFYLVNNSVNEAISSLIRFTIDGTSYDIISITSGDYLFGVGNERTIIGGIPE